PVRTDTAPPIVLAALSVSRLLPSPTTTDRLPTTVMLSVFSEFTPLPACISRLPLTTLFGAKAVTLFPPPRRKLTSPPTVAPEPGGRGAPAALDDVFPPAAGVDRHAPAIVAQPDLAAAQAEAVVPVPDTESRVPGHVGGDDDVGVPGPALVADGPRGRVERL